MLLNLLPEFLVEFLDFKLFGKTVLVVDKQFGAFLVNPLRK